MNYSELKRLDKYYNLIDGSYRPEESEFISDADIKKKAEEIARKIKLFTEQQKEKLNENV